MRPLAASTALSGALLALFVGCGPEPAESRGERRFGDPRLSTAPSNLFACSTCHGVSASEARRLPGYLLAGATARTSYWGGAERTLLGAVNQCLTEFMRGQPLSAEDEEGRALYAYLRSLPTRAVEPALPLTVVKDIVDVPNGDAARGGPLYGRACAACHGAAHTGAGRLGPRVSIIPEETIQTFGRDPQKGARPITIEKIRHGKFFNIGGVMPLFSVEALTDAEVGDLLALLGL